VAVNILVAALILMNRKGWTYRELFTQIDFDLLTRTALGVTTIDETPFSEATIFNFQNRLNDHYVKTGENLFERVFDGLTQEQLKALKLKTNIQRSDSFLAATNIRSYSRLQLLIEVILRLYRVLSDDDKAALKDQLGQYVNKSSGQYIYGLERGEIPHEMKKIGEVYHWVHELLKGRYEGVEILEIFERVYGEHFTEVEEKIEVKPSEELHSGMLQSPDDVDATYRKKREQESRGQTVHLTETANPENPINLITDIAVAPNNRDDSTILQERLEPMKTKTPDLEELHTDGGYGSSANDEKMEALEITHIQTAVKGKVAEVPFKIEEKGINGFIVSCPMQKVAATKTKKRYKAAFNLEICTQCPFLEKCPTNGNKEHRAYYFTRKTFLVNRRQHNIKKIPFERRKIRPNVEATVKECKNGMQTGKLKVRGQFKVMVYAVLRAISVNFGRVYRHVCLKAQNAGLNGRVWSKWLGLMILFSIFMVCTLFRARGKRLFLKKNWGPTPSSWIGYQFCDMVAVRT
jgi:hypothetical protein